jgi:predicted nucleotidyltransferase
LNDLGITKDQIVILSVSGSNMYGTANENSDEDYLGVFMPTKDDILMNSVKKQVHLPKESGLDLQMWSIYYFLKLALQGETMAIDLLHSPR